MDNGEILRYLKKAPPEGRDKIAAELMKPTSHQDFFPRLSTLAFARAIKSDVFLPNLNAMRIPITLHTAQKKANDIAFLDCGATECFISQCFIDQHKLGVHLMENP